jgi:hypothetical protein
MSERVQREMKKSGALNVCHLSDPQLQDMHAKTCMRKNACGPNQTGVSLSMDNAAYLRREFVITNRPRMRRNRQDNARVYCSSQEMHAASIVPSSSKSACGALGQLRAREINISNRHPADHVVESVHSVEPCKKKKTRGRIM